MAKAKANDAVKMDEADASTDLIVQVAPAAPIKFNTNFAELKKELKKNLTKYKGMKVSDANFEQCKLVQKQCVTTRTLLDTRMKETIRMYIDLPKDTLKAQFNELLALVAEVEDGLKNQMQVFEDERRDELTVILKGYIKKLQEEFKLAPKYVEMVELKKSYYNKTAKEAETRADLKAQFQSALDEQNRYQQDIDLINSTINGNKLISASTWIAQLEYRSVASIIFDIKSELLRLEAVTEPAPDAIKIGAPVTSMTDDRETKPVASKKKKTMRIEITYPENYGQMIKDFFSANPEIKVVSIK